MAQVLRHKLRSTEQAPVFGVIELSEGEGYYLAEFNSLPSVPHLPQTYEFFDENEDIPMLEDKYKIDLSDYELVYHNYQNSDI
ncbi:hypothetical protein MUK70_12715 [Dyadobacter chenwenxiniae]|uniref:Uncharacterized protein n=1 Tax=Dyadobacter chenwenxiniae TaxID=2906456 RepID=A0A9X1PF57_9BACT|nr:hypothetical protein [Dyadobacter chenwenxiniae]MCF0060105.1 hypothetical protein [Dyadobacter chenwenxiniae]UON85843.1 hypothetical protein MUK70_12715 [Dyadobacter chenwenxiniae]